MGLFSRKKKPAAAEEAPRAQAPQAAVATRNAQQVQQVHHAQQAQEAAKKAAEQQKIAEEERTMKKIADKRTDIKQLERALGGFEAERNRLKQLALKARQEGKENEMKAHMRAATRLQQRIKRYQDMVINHQTQLDALEDAAFNKEGVQKTKAFVEDMDELAVDRDEIDKNLEDMREAIAGVNDVNLTFEADSSMNKGIYDDEDAMAELDALEAQQAQGAASEIPAVPGETPTMPVAQAANASEEEEIRKLEAELAM